jgi:hypothetical protein
VIPLLHLMAAAVRPNGLVLIDVPNMDWLFAGHERYMDFTHEGGFTTESLRQTIALAFRSVEVRPVDNVGPGRRFGRRWVGRRLLGTLLAWADPEGGSGPIWARSLVAVARDPKATAGQSPQTS